MSALACLTGQPAETRLLAHVQMEMALAEVRRRRSAGILAVAVRPLEETWPAYFRRHHQEKDAATQAKAELIAPGPERTSREPWPDGFAVPSPVASVAKLAEAAGWLTEVRYARGSVVCRRKGPDGTMGRAIERRHSVALRAWDPARNLHAVAVWESAVDAEKLSWKAELAKVWKVGEFPLEVGVTALKALMKETTYEGDDVRDYVRAEMDEVTLEPVWWVGTFLPAETVATWPWHSLQALADALEKGGQQLFGRPLGAWELKHAEYSLIMDGWVVRFRVWPL